MESKLDKGLKACNLRIICVLLMQTETHACKYRVYTSDGGYSDYIGFQNVPKLVRDWMQERNTWEYVIPSAMVISGVGVV